MPLIDKSYNVDEKCHCGRRMCDIHCVDCGSLSVIKRALLKTLRVVHTDDPTPREIHVAVYHCRRCAIDFDETKRFNCEAPALQLSMKAQRTQDTTVKTLDTMSEAERKQVLNELFNKDKKGKPN